MATPQSRRRPTRTGDPDVDAQLDVLLDTVGTSANRDQVLELLATVVRLARDGTERLDLKIANAALRGDEGGVPAVRPLQGATEDHHVRLRPNPALGPACTPRPGTLPVPSPRRAGTSSPGPGPGIMAAGLEGAGPDHSFGINIRLPFEQEANEFIAADPKLVSMKYFFTRKLLLIKESDAYAVLPGGFGTLDEAFELLTLLQTGKAMPAPIVMVDVPGGTYWHEWEDWVAAEIEARRLIDHEDRLLYRITDSVEQARAEVLGVLPQLPLPALRRRHAGHPAEGPRRRRRRRPPCRRSSPTCARAARITRARRPAATGGPQRRSSSTCPGWPCASTGSPTPACAC